MKRVARASRSYSLETTIATGWHLPAAVAKFGERLFDQQLWCWGRDIEQTAGNLLLDYGFRRQPPPPRDAERSTCYRFDAPSRHIALWGFGMFYGQRRYGGLYLGRALFRPAWSPVESLSSGIHWPDDLPFFGRPKAERTWIAAHRLFASLCQWIASYERWVRRRAGTAYRQSCVASWLRPWVRGECMATAWHALARRLWEHSPEAWSCRNSWLVSTAQASHHAT
jgi:hypothetical protein